MSGNIGARRLIVGTVQRNGPQLKVGGEKPEPTRGEDDQKCVFRCVNGGCAWYNRAGHTSRQGNSFYCYT